jgi:hypothetical protein
MQNISRVIWAICRQVGYRVNWFCAVSHSPSNTLIGWNAIILGNVQLGEQTNVQNIDR